MKNNGAITGRVVKVYPDLGCVRVVTQKPYDDLDYVPVTQKLRGIYGLPAEGDTVLLVPVNGGALIVCTDILPSVAVAAHVKRHTARPPLHLRTGNEPALPFSALLRHNVVVDTKTVKLMEGEADGR